MQRFIPTFEQLIRATLVGLASHPLLKDPKIYDTNNNPITISKWRSYGGYELETPGLVCSVYPDYTGRKTRGSSPPGPRRASIQYKPYTLGSHTFGSHDEATANLVIELQYLDGTFGEFQTVTYNLAQYIDGSPILDESQGNLASEAQLSRWNYSKPSAVQLLQQSIQIEILPAEVILRQYIELIRLALASLYTLQPYAIKSTQVVSADFPTSSWTRDNTDLVLHSAYIIWEVCFYPSNDWAKDLHG
jgi:hypothetical protein